jgi:hypothetical protein
MRSYPVTVRVPPKITKRLSPAIALELRNKIEDYLNERAKDSPETVLTYPQIATATGIDKEIVARNRKLWRYYRWQSRTKA